MRYIEAVRLAQEYTERGAIDHADASAGESEWFVVRWHDGDWSVLTRRSIETVERIHRASGKVPVWTVEGPFYAEAEAVLGEMAAREPAIAEMFADLADK